MIHTQVATDKGLVLHFNLEDHIPQQASVKETAMSLTWGRDQPCQGALFVTAHSGVH